VQAAANEAADDASSAKTLGLIGLIVGAVGLIVAIVALVVSDRRRKGTV
jgi:biopolymer transport protein ExbB/TolQ